MATLLYQVYEKREGMMQTIHFSLYRFLLFIITCECVNCFNGLPIYPNHQVFCNGYHKWHIVLYGIYISLVPVINGNINFSICPILCSPIEMIFLPIIAWYSAQHWSQYSIRENKRLDRKIWNIKYCALSVMSGVQKEWPSFKSTTSLVISVIILLSLHEEDAT